MRRLTLGQLARASGLARASLLHYEALGLLLPAGRSEAGYRCYGEAELARLQGIRRFREAGLSLAAIGELLGPVTGGKGHAGEGDGGPAAVLEARLLDLCREVERLRAQQKQLARLLTQPEFRAGKALGGKDAWVALLRRAGFDEDDMRQWHADFEAESPAEHAAFLRALGLSAAEAAAIRRRSKRDKHGPGASEEQAT